MDGSAANLDRDDGVEDTDGDLERLEILVLVREHTEVVVVHPEADTRVNVLLRWLEPRIALRLEQKRQSAYRAQARRTQGTATYLLEDVVQKRIIRIVIHGGRKDERRTSRGRTSAQPARDGATGAENGRPRDIASL